MNYAEQLRDSRWIERSEQVKTDAGRRCEECGEDDKGLDVHHSYYQNGLMAWEYPDEALHCLCHECHEIRAQEERELLKAVHCLKRWQIYELAKHIRTMMEGQPQSTLAPVMPQFRREMKRGWQEILSQSPQ